MGFYKDQASFLPPISRRNDPVTSKAAEQAITRSGKRSGDVMKAAELVKQKPGSTCRELSKFFNVDNEMLHKRLPDAAKAGLIGQSGNKICSVTGRLAATWEPIVVTWWPKGYGK